MIISKSLRTFFAIQNDIKKQVDFKYIKNCQRRVADHSETLYCSVY